MYLHLFLVVDVLHWRHTLVEAGSCGTLAALFPVLPLQHWHLQLTLVDRSAGHYAALSAVPQLMLCAQIVALYGECWIASECIQIC